MLWLAAVGGQVLLAALCVAWRERVLALVAAHTSPYPPAPLEALLQVPLAWLLLAAAFHLSQRGMAQRCWGRSFLWAAIARASVIPTAILASPPLLGTQFGRVELDLGRRFPIVLDSLTPALFALAALYVLAVLFALFAHAWAYGKAAGVRRVPPGRFLVTLLLAAGAAHAVSALADLL